MLHSMTTRLIHVYKLETFYVCCGSGVKEMSLRVRGIKSLFWYHFHNTLSWAWAVAGWETTLSRARPVAGWETTLSRARPVAGWETTLSRARPVAGRETILTGASHWIICSYANPQCWIECLFLFLKMCNLRFTYRLTYLAPLARAQFLVLSFFLSFFSCQPHNLMYLRAPLTDFKETWSQWLMTQPAYVIWPLTWSKVIQDHIGQKCYFH